MQLIVVSGRSGSGKTVALRVLEDLGYYCVDNLPVNLLPQLIVSVESQYDKLAVS
ncbi:MAG: RNase adapter RapZ, partial [Aeromonas sobria]